MSASMFLMQLRVAAQGAVVGCMTLGLTYSMLREYVLDKKPISAESKWILILANVILIKYTFM